MSRIFLLLVFLFAFNGVFAQSYSTRKNTTKRALKYYQSGRESANAGDHERALKFFAKAIKEDPKLIDAKINLANLNYDMGDYEKAIGAYDEVLIIAPDYDPDLYYNLGMAHWKSQHFAKANQNFNTFLKKEIKPTKRVRRAKTYIRNAAFAEKAYANPVPYNPERLSDSINTMLQEYLPAISADDETFIFTRNERGDENFFISQRTANGWSIAKPLDAINSSLNEGAQTLSADGRWFIFTACNRKGSYGSCDLFYSRRKGSSDSWTEPRNMGKPINSRAWESQPSLSPDGRTLFFVSAREGGQGGRDIWMSNRLPKNKWSEPVNLGDVINSVGDEQSPFMHFDGETLYFMSDGHPGMGETDLYFSKLQEDGSWSEPENLGYPINTEDHEGALFVARDGKTAYFATDRLAKQHGDVVAEGNPFKQINSRVNLDIFKFELPKAARANEVTYVKAIIRDAQTKEPLSATAQMTDLATQEASYEGYVGKSGSLLVCLPMGGDFALHVSKKGYLFHSENFSLREMTSLADPFLLEIFLEKIPVKEEVVTTTTTPPPAPKPVILKNVFFTTGSAVLRSQSMTELMKLKYLLEKESTIRIQINGHTDDVGDDAANQQLSQDRAKAVYDWLIEQGIAASRLSFKGFGESQPIDSNETDEGRQRNRRTEFVIL